MSIQIDWVNDSKTCILLTYGKGWDWDDFFAASPKVAGMLDSIDHTADTLHDVRNTAIPRNVISQFPKFTRGSVSLKHPNAGVLVFVGVHPYLKILTQMFQKLYADLGRRVFLVNTMEDARQLLADRAAAPG
jgi:hypothetical protein